VAIGAVANEARPLALLRVSLIYTQRADALHATGSVFGIGHEKELSAKLLNNNQKEEEERNTTQNLTNHANSFCN